jgi:hypothetical protein
MANCSMFGIACLIKNSIKMGSLVNNDLPSASMDKCLKKIKKKI